MMALSVLAMGVTPALAQEHGTADEAVALVKKAVAFYQSQGRDKAFAAFADANGGFQNRDLYVFVQESSGNTLVHKNAGLVGKDVKVFKDADGKMFGVEIMETCMKKGSGWIDYRWGNSTTKKIEAKSTYVEQNSDLCFGAGIYK
jgi:signal transduction histidine kinase